MNFGFFLTCPPFAVVTAGTQAICTPQFGAKTDPYYPDFYECSKKHQWKHANLTFCNEGIDFWDHCTLCSF